MSMQIIPLTSLVCLCLIMGIAWKRQKKTANAGIVDLIWAASLGLLALIYAWQTEGWGPRRVLVGTLAGLWSLRLTWHLTLRYLSEREDGRYAVLRSQWGVKFDSTLFWFYQAQAILSVLLSLSFLLLCASEESGWRIQDGFAVLVWLGAWIGQATADKQLSIWRTDPVNQGRTCRSGLWAYSRHPNYFFEWCGWLVYPLLGIGLPWGATLWLAPLLMLYLVIKVTGIPPTEEQSLRSRGDDYRDYQFSTNAFFPGRPKDLNRNSSTHHENSSSPR
jgi:steroid 5-alpha reductase family enzyme